MLQSPKICKRISFNLQLIPPSENPTQNHSYTSLLMTPLHVKVLNILILSILFLSNSCSSALSGFHSTLSFLSILTNFLTTLLSLLLPSLLLARLPAFYLDRPFGFPIHPRILFAFWTIYGSFFFLFLILSSRIVKVMLRTTIPLPHT